MWLRLLQSSVASPGDYLTSLLRLVNSDYGSILFVVALIIMSVLWRHYKKRLKGLLELLGSTDGSDFGTLEGNSLASNIGYLLNKYTRTWEVHGLNLSRDLEALGLAVDRLERLSANNEEYLEEAVIEPHKNILNALLFDDERNEEDVEGDDE